MEEENGEATSEEVRIQETWVYAGTRLKGEKGTGRFDTWLPLPLPDDKDSHVNYRILKFDREIKRSHLAVGSEYDVTVIRGTDGVTLCGNPRYIGRHDNEELRAKLQALHLAAEAEIKVRGMAAADKADSALERALEPLVAIAAETHTLQRTAFVAYVMDRLMRAWK